jgi:hypothetical protein
MLEITSVFQPLIFSLEISSLNRQQRRSGSKVGKSIRGQFDYGGTFGRDTFQREILRRSDAVASTVAAAGSFGTFARGLGYAADSGPPALLVRPAAAKEPRIEKAVLDSDLEESEIMSNAYIRKKALN